MPKTAAAGAPVTVSAEVQNAGSIAADEVVQVYVTNVGSGLQAPGSGSGA